MTTVWVFNFSFFISVPMQWVRRYFRAVHELRAGGKFVACFSPPPHVN